MKKIILTILVSMFLGISGVFSDNTIGEVINLNDNLIEINLEEETGIGEENLESDVIIYNDMSNFRYLKFSSDTFIIEFESELLDSSYDLLGLNLDYNAKIIIIDNKVKVKSSEGIDSIILISKNKLKIKLKKDILSNLDLKVYLSIPVKKIFKGKELKKIFLIPEYKFLKGNSYLGTITYIKGKTTLKENKIKKGIFYFELSEKNNEKINNSGGEIYYNYEKNYNYISIYSLEELLIKSKENLKKINKDGDKIINRIDNFIKKYENNLEVLNKLYNKINFIEVEKLEVKSENKFKLLSIKDYLEIKTIISIKNIEKKNNDEKEKKKKEKAELLEKKAKEFYKNTLSDKEQKFIDNELLLLQNKFLEQLIKIQKNLIFQSKGKADISIKYEDKYLGKINSKINVKDYILKFNGLKGLNFDLTTNLGSELISNKISKILTLGGNFRYLITKRDGYLFSNNIKENYQEKLKNEKQNILPGFILSKLGKIIKSNNTNKYLWDNAENINGVDNFLEDTLSMIDFLTKNKDKNLLTAFKKEGNKYYLIPSKESFGEKINDKDYQKLLSSFVGKMDLILNIGKKENIIYISQKLEDIHDKGEKIRINNKTILTKEYNTKSTNYKFYKNLVIGKDKDYKSIYSDIINMTDITIDFENKNINGIFFVEDISFYRYKVKGYNVKLDMNFNNKLDFFIKTEKNGESELDKKWEIKGNIDQNIELKDDIKIIKPKQEDLFEYSEYSRKKL